MQLNLLITSVIFLNNVLFGEHYHCTSSSTQLSYFELVTKNWKWLSKLSSIFPLTCSRCTQHVYSWSNVAWIWNAKSYSVYQWV